MANLIYNSGILFNTNFQGIKSIKQKDPTDTTHPIMIKNLKVNPIYPKKPAKFQQKQWIVIVNKFLSIKYKTNFIF